MPGRERVYTADSFCKEHQEFFVRKSKGRSANGEQRFTYACRKCYKTGKRSGGANAHRVPNCKHCGTTKIRQPKGPWVCPPCNRKKASKYGAKPEVKAKRKAKNSTPEAKAALETRHRKPSVCKKCGRPKTQVTPTSRFRCKACDAKYDSQHQPIYYDKNRDKLIAKALQWQRENADGKRKATKHKRRAKELGAEGFWTDEDWEAIKAAHNYTCFDFGVELWGRVNPRCGGNTKPLTVGHAHPLEIGGSNWPANLIPQCQSCNTRQKDKMHPVAGRIHEYRDVALRDSDDLELAS